MLFNTKLLYTPTLSLNEFGPRSLVIDFETIGSSDFSEPIEVALGNHHGQIVFDSPVRPVFNPLPSPSKLKRFDREALRRAPTWAEIWPELSELITGKTLIAFNAPYDRRTLAAACARHRVTNPEWGWRCAMRLVMEQFRLKRSITLTQACALVGLEGGNHRAARDVEVTCRLLLKLREGAGNRIIGTT